MSFAEFWILRSPIIKYVALDCIYLSTYFSLSKTMMSLEEISQTLFIFVSYLFNKGMLKNIQAIQMFKEWMNEKMRHQPAILFYVHLYFY